MAHNIAFVKHQTINDNLQTDLINLISAATALKIASKSITDDIINLSTQLKTHLRRAIDKFYTVINTIDDIICIKDPMGKWKTLNTFGQTFYNLSEDDYIGKTTEEISTNFPNIHESLLCTESNDVLNKPITKNIRQFPLNDNEYFFNITKTQIFTRDNIPKELIIIGKDITNQINETRKNHACLAALNSASEAITLLDKHKNIIFFNTAFIDIFPNTKNHTQINEIYQSTDPQYEIDKWNKVMDCNIWCHQLTSLINDKLITCEEKIIPIMNGDIKPIHYICLLKFNE